MTETIKEKSIRTKFIRSLIILGLVNMLIFIAIVVYMFEQNNRLHFLRNIQNTESFYKSLIQNDVKMLSAALDSFTTNDIFKTIFLKNDRKALENKSADIFKSNKEKYGITHFYYIDKDDQCFLRMHKPSFFGDTILRKTFLNAKKNLKKSSGIEMGKTAYAIRVVQPYFSDKKHVGYVEFGEEIDHFDQIIKKETGSEIIVLGLKDSFSEDKYRAARLEMGQKDKWDELDNFVILSNTLAEDEFFKSYFYKNEDANVIDKATYLDRVKFNKSIYMRGVFPFFDVTGKKTGLVYILNDVTHHIEQFRLMLLIIIFFGVVLLLIAFYITLRFLQNDIIKSLTELSNKADEISLGKNLGKEIMTERNDEIGKLIRSFERMRKSLYMSIRRLKKIKKSS